MHVIYKDGTVYAVDMQCPCGCGAGCFTPIIGEHHERNKPPGFHAWDYAPGPTLTPSIRYMGGCKAHFNITAGKVIVHGDSGQ